MNKEAFFLQHQIDLVSAKFGLDESVCRKIVDYVAKTAQTNQQDAVKILQAAQSPSAKKLVEILKLDDRDETDKQIDEAYTQQHDPRVSTTYSPQEEPYTQFYSMFSIPAGEVGSTTPGP